jgi:protein-arginine kinase activator protein McsA
MEKVLCYSCNKSKANLNLKRSALLAINLLMCETCITSKFEPRWTIILSGRQHGHESVKEYITKKKYVGEDIKASELLV